MSRRYVIDRLVFCTQTPDYVYLCLKRASVRKTRTLSLCLCLGLGGGILGCTGNVTSGCQVGLLIIYVEVAAVW